MSFILPDSDSKLSEFFANTCCTSKESFDEMKTFFRLSWWSNQVTATIVVFVYVTIFCHFGWNRIHPTLDGLVLGAVVLHIIISFPPDAMCKALDDLWVDCIDSDCWLPSYSWVVLRDGLLVLCSFIGVIALRYSLTHPVQLCDPAPYVLIDEPPLSNLSSQRTRSTDQQHLYVVTRHVLIIQLALNAYEIVQSVTEYHVSYNLEEAARLFQAIKNIVDWSTIKLPTATATRDNAAEMIHRDELYARRLHAEFLQERERAVVIDRTPQANQTASAQHQPVGYLKNCGHRCDLRTTQRCCTCSDRRPRRQGNTYETYVDGQGVVNCAARNEFYCSTCKRQ
ncbi:unnamed protein product [Adineta ricciae]|uniref:Transmembrane protein n=1 Tax=Adineta ricciae TaxID=249248 RepID=A0A815BIC5_ADIRI|nr:unnamed protein product [Adineta ricciae]